MADIFDQGQETEALHRAHALKVQAKKAAAEPKLQPTGHCYNPLCNDDLDGERLFCGPECAAEHSKFKRLKGVL